MPFLHYSRFQKKALGFGRGLEAKVERNQEEIFQNFKNEGIEIHDDSLKLCEWKKAWSSLAITEIGRLSGHSAMK